MADERIKEIVNFLLRCLTNEFVKIDKIFLFGSYSVGAETEESDLDIGIISSDFINKNIFERAKLVSNAERQTIKEFKVPLDIVMLTPDELSNETTLIASYIKNGKMIFAA